MPAPENTSRTTTSTMKPLVRLATALCFALTLGASLWPFDFQTRCTDCPNGVRIGPERAGLSFPNTGLVKDETAGPLLHARLSGSPGITIAVHAMSETSFQGGPARIISFSDGASERNFTLGQHRDAIVLRLRTPLTGKNGSDPATIADGVVSTRMARLFVAAYDGAVFRIYADGVLEAERRLAAGAFDGWAPDFALYYGNEATGDRPWRGHLLDAAVYDRAMGQDEVAGLKPADLGLQSPGRVLHLGSRCPPTELIETENGMRAGTCFAPARFENQHAWDVLRVGLRAPSDYAQNLLAWLPLGVLLALTDGAWLRRRRVPVACVLACVILGAEIGQSALFSRTSALLDAFFAMLGALVGTWIGSHAPAVLKRRFKS